MAGSTGVMAVFLHNSRRGEHAGKQMPLAEEQQGSPAPSGRTERLMENGNGSAL